MTDSEWKNYIQSEFSEIKSSLIDINKCITSIREKVPETYQNKHRCEILHAENSISHNHIYGWIIGIFGTIIGITSTFILFIKGG